MESGKRVWTKGIFISVVALVVGALALNGWALNKKDDQDKLLVTVEGVDITRGDVDHKIDTLLGSQATALPPEKLAQIRSNLDKRVLQNMIIETLLTKAVKDQQITITDGEVEKVMSDLKGSLPPDTDFGLYLKSIGFSEKDLAQTISRDLKIKKLLETQVAGLNAPTDAEIQKFYDENSEQFNTPEGMLVRHILIAVTPKDDEAKHQEKRAKAEDIRRRLVEEKEDFAAIAAKESDGPSKVNGGNIGVVTRGRTVKPFEDAVFSQKVGEIGPLVKTQFGYHIIQVTKKQTSGKVSLTEAKPSIVNHLLSMQKEKLLNDYVDSLKSKAKIVYHDEALAAAKPAAG
jgi:peptidyl-prolyl cis-trans isomerase C